MLRLRYADPYDVGMVPADFRQIDSIAKRMISDKAAPGCQVLVAWKDRIVYHKAFGRHTYDRESQSVALTDVYDVASVTKVASTALAAMKLVDMGKLDISKPASHYLPELRNSNKKDLLISEIMTHTAGLKSWIPFYQQTLENGKPSYNYYHKKPDVNYTVPVCDSLYISKTYAATMWDVIVESSLGVKGKLVYSDLGLIILQRVIEQVSGMPLDRFVYDEFYQPLGLTNIMYSPWTTIPLSRIPPTEKDTAFRKKLIKGYVHDPAAAMMGGVSGHAGLFSDSYSLAVIMQMLINGGEYGGMRFFSSKTIQLFTSKFPSGEGYRGLLFDKPDRRKGEPENTAKLASVFTYGHTGFTGTAVWADPEHDLVFVFLSNRVYPNAEPNKLSKGRYRPSMMQAAYDVILRKAKMPSQ
jgi:CubicO group peptidase (beta-lactamase class C family)